MTPVGRRRWLTHALDRLPARERRIVEARRLADPAVSLEQLGCELGVSKERVRQLEQHALCRTAAGRACVGRAHVAATRYRGLRAFSAAMRVPSSR
jgi:RNA polymerase sigma-32 factor